MVKSGKTIYSKLNYIYIPSGRGLKKYFLFSVILSYCTYVKSSIKTNPFSQSSPCTFLYPILCVHLDRACELLCDPNRKGRGCCQHPSLYPHRILRR